MKTRLLALALLTASCASPVVADVATTTVPTTLPAPPPAIAALQPIPEPAAMELPTVVGPGPTVATVRGRLAIYPDPWSSEPGEYLPEKTILGTQTVLRVIDVPSDGWVQVSLPGRPNGRTGWIRVADVDLSTASSSIRVDLESRRMDVFRDGKLLITTPVAVGSATSPTPAGTFFVTDAIDLSAHPGAWGPFAFGLSARSDVITEFNGGDGIIGIHGTNRPSSIGEARSLGCIRVPNDVIAEMARVIELGTVVEIGSWPQEAATATPIEPSPAMTSGLAR